MQCLQFHVLPANAPFSTLKPKPKPRPEPPTQPPYPSPLHPHHLSNSLSPLKAHKQRAPTAAAALGTTTEDVALPEGLQPELIPRHVAVIMDGNVRWARQKGLGSGAGHEAGVRSLLKLVDMCVNMGIKVLTVFAFSYDNWTRPKVEVAFLMSLFETKIHSEVDKLARKGIRISVIGDSSKLPTSLQELIARTEDDTKDNTKLQLIIAVSYSGKYDIIQACKNISQKVKDGIIQVGEINEGMIEQELETNCTEFPNPDLMIRTSGELRVSNFLLWQMAYTELFFVRSLWPDFGEEEFVEALRSFQQRNRRYGGRHLQPSNAI